MKELEVNVISYILSNTGVDSGLSMHGNLFLFFMALRSQPVLYSPGRVGHPLGGWEFYSLLGAWFRISQASKTCGGNVILLRLPDHIVKSSAGRAR